VRIPPQYNADGKFLSAAPTFAPSTPFVASDLIDVWGLLHDATVAGLGPAPRSEEELFREASYDVYSDGTPVAALVGIPGRDAGPVPIELCEGDIGRQGPPAPGWQIVVGDPPHERLRSSARTTRRRQRAARR
jgi:hypothetical protein